MCWLRELERLLLIFGTLMLALYVTARIHQTVLSKSELQRFKTQQLLSAARSHGVVPTTDSPDFSLWSGQRIKDYQRQIVALLRQLSDDNYDAAVRIASIPEAIRGYDSVKDESAKRALQLQQAHLTEFAEASLS